MNIRGAVGPAGYERDDAHVLSEVESASQCGKALCWKTSCYDCLLGNDRLSRCQVFLEMSCQGRHARVPAQDMCYVSTATVMLVRRSPNTQQCTLRRWQQSTGHILCC